MFYIDNGDEWPFDLEDDEADALLEELTKSIEKENDKYWPNDSIKDTVVNRDAEPPEALEIKKTCFHSWSTYTGLVEIFEYCEDCGIKKVDAR